MNYLLAILGGAVGGFFAGRWAYTGGIGRAKAGAKRHAWQLAQKHLQGLEGHRKHHGRRKGIRTPQQYRFAACARRSHGHMGAMSACLNG